MADGVVRIRYRLRRQETGEVPTDLKYGEPVYMHEEKALYMGGPDGSQVLIAQVTQPGTSAQGPPGPIGETGAPGDRGLQGPIGETGAPGAQGPSGTTALHVGPTPPTDLTKLLWTQTDVNTQVVIERWQRRSNNVWVSDRQWVVVDFINGVSASRTAAGANPCPSSGIWIEDFMARGRFSSTPTTGSGWDFSFGYVNANSGEIYVWMLSINQEAIASSFKLVEKVGLILNETEAIALRFKTTLKGTATISHVTLGATLRKVYNAAN